MQPDPTPDLAELERLEKAATPGPWDIQLRARSGRVMHVGGHVYAEEGRRLIAGCRGASGYALEEHDANAALIAAARNALPWLLRAARELDELRARAEKAEAKIGEIAWRAAEVATKLQEAEARAKELEATVDNLGDSHDEGCNQGNLCNCTRKVRREIAGAALAQKEPR